MPHDGIELKDENLLIDKEFEHRLEHYISHNKNNTVLELLSNFPKLNHYKFHNHMTLAHFSSKYDNVTLLASLIANGCDLEATTKQEMQTPLCICCINGSANCAFLLIENKAILDHHDIYGNTSLFYALQRDCIQVCKHLLKHGSTYKYGLMGSRSIFQDLEEHQNIQLIAELAECIKRYFNRIHLATKLNLTTLLRYYLQKYPHIDIDEKNDIGMTSAHIASKNNCISVIKVLQEHGANFTIKDHQGHLPIHLAVKYNSKEVLEMLLPNHLHEINAPDQLGYSILMHAIMSGLDISILEKFIQIGANENNRFKKNGNTALHLAVIHRRLDVVKLLLSNNFTVDITNNDDVTPLHLAINIENNKEIVEVLMDNKADVLLESKAGMNALFYSLYNGFNNYFQMALDHCSNVNYINKDGYGALHLACSIGNYECVKLLVLHGSALDIRGKFGESPLHWAAWRNHVNIAKLLLDHGVAIDSIDENNNTALHYSCMKGHFEVSQLLLTLGAHPNHMNNDGVTPGICAVRGNSHKLVKLLVQDFSIDIDYRVQGSYSLMYYAMYCGNLAIVNFLLNNTLALDEVIDDRFTPFAIAVLCDNAELCFQLYSLYNYTCSKPFTSFKFTITHLIGIAGSVKTFKVLSHLKRFRDTLQTSNKFGDTILHFAATYGHYNLCYQLTKLCPQLILKQNCNGFRPIHCAIIAKQYTIFKLLYKLNNDDHCVDHYNNNFAHLSVLRCANKITFDLLKHFDLFDAKNCHGLTPRTLLSALNILKQLDLTFGESKKNVEFKLNHDPTLEEEILNITQLDLDVFIKILYEYLNVTNLGNFVDYFRIPKDISVCLRMKLSSRFSPNKFSIEYTHCVFDDEITQFIESHLHSTRLCQNQSSSENHGWIYCRIPNDNELLNATVKPSLLNTNQDNLMLELVDCGLVAFYNGLIVIIPHQPTETDQVTVNIKRLSQSTRHEVSINADHCFYKRLSNFLEITITEGAYKKTLTCYVGYNKESLILNTSKAFNHEYVSLLKMDDVNDNKWVSGTFVPKDICHQLTQLTSLFNSHNRSNKFLFYSLEFHKKMCCFVCYQPNFKNLPPQSISLSNNTNFSVKIIPSNRIRFDKKYSSTFSDIIRVDPRRTTEKEFTAVFSVILNGHAPDQTSLSISDYKIFRYDPKSQNNYWILSSQDFVIGINKNVIDIKIVFSKVCYVWIFCDGGRLSKNHQLLVNRSFTNSINFYYNTLIKVTIMRNRKWINNALVIFEFSVALPTERKQFIELNQKEFYLTFTKQQEITLAHGQQLQIMALVDEKSAGFLDCNHRYLPYINYFADPWSSNTFNCYLTPMAFSQESTNLDIRFLDPEINNDQKLSSLAVFSVTL